MRLQKQKQQQHARIGGAAGKWHAVKVTPHLLYSVPGIVHTKIKSTYPSYAWFDHCLIIHIYMKYIHKYIYLYGPEDAPAELIFLIKTKKIDATIMKTKKNRTTTKNATFSAVCIWLCCLVPPAPSIFNLLQITPEAREDFCTDDKRGFRTIGKCPPLRRKRTPLETGLRGIRYTSCNF